MSEHFYDPMFRVIPEGEQGSARVYHFWVEDDHALHANRKSLLRGTPIMNVRAGIYAALSIENELYMSDMAPEKRSYEKLLTRAHGKVLIAGLGLGMILRPFARNPQIEQVTIVEKNPDVAALVWPHVKSDKFQLELVDIFDYDPAAGPWDVIYFDIWPAITAMNIPDMVRLHRRFKKSLNPENPRAWMASWQARWAVDQFLEALKDKKQEDIRDFRDDLEEDLFGHE